MSNPAFQTMMRSLKELPSEQLAAIMEEAELVVAHLLLHPEAVVTTNTGARVSLSSSGDLVINPPQNDR